MAGTFLICLSGVVDRRVDHGKVEERRRPGWTSTGEDRIRRDHVQLGDRVAAAGATQIRQEPMMRPVSLRSLVIVFLLWRVSVLSSRLERTEPGWRSRSD